MVIDQQLTTVTQMSHPGAPRTSSRALRGAAFAAIVSALVAWSVLAKGIPALRHDWRIPVEPGTTANWLAGFFQPWSDLGLGSANPYPTFYWIALTLWPFHQLSTAFPLLCVIVGGTAFLAASGALRVARNFGAPEGYGYAAAAVAVLNPWVYSKYVAGHIFMVTGYAVILALIGEVTRERPRTWALILLAMACVTQLQFFVVACVPFVWWCARNRRMTPIVAIIAGSLPIIFGMAFRYHEIRNTPYTLAWQMGQSVPLQHGVLLNGYTFHYADAFNQYWPAMALLCVAAIFGLILKTPRRLALIIGIVSAGAVLFASGTSGMFGAPYSWIVLHVPESGLFRELYDLIALAAIAYVVGLASWRGSWSRAALVVILPAAAVLIVPWIVRPVYTFFVPGSALPGMPFTGRYDERLALFPAFQPLIFQNRGSGYDPNLFRNADGASPINEFLPSFPVNAALSYEWLHHSDSMLAALGVSHVVSRAWFHSDWPTLRYQEVTLAEPRSLPSSRALAAVPIIAISNSIPGITTSAQDLVSNGVFLSDALPGSVSVLHALRDDELDYTRHWVDTRFASLTHPEWSTALDGVLTSGSEFYPLPSGNELLADVNGKLVDSRNRVIATTNSSGQRWWPIPPSAKAVRCSGQCALIAVFRGQLPRPLRMTAWKPLHWQEFSPYLYIAAITPSGAYRTVRFAERYSSYWTAFIGGHSAQHYRLNSVLNGWLLPPRSGGKLYLVETVALAQFIVECLSCLVIVVLLIREILMERTRNTNRKTPKLS